MSSGKILQRMRVSSARNPILIIILIKMTYEKYKSIIIGCYYNGLRYSEGEQIVTNEPCLNCTCHNQMLMCFLKVCPFIKPIGKHCVVEKKPDQCCPTIMCPQGKILLLTSGMLLAVAVNNKIILFHSFGNEPSSSSRFVDEYSITAVDYR